MPLGKNISKNIKELYADNKKTGSAKGANGKVRPKRQIVAIAINATRKNKSPKISMMKSKKMSTSDGYMKM